MRHGVFSSGRAVAGLCVILSLWSGHGAAAPTAMPGTSPPAEQHSAEPTDDTSQQARELITALENDEQRQQLIDKLRLLAETKEGRSQAAVETSAVAMLSSLSARLDRLTGYFNTVAANINQLPAAGAWILTQARDPQARRVWGEAAGSLVAVIGLGYAAFFAANMLVNRLRRPAPKRSSGSPGTRAARAAGWLLAKLLPVAVFAGVAYAMIGILELAEQTRLAALAWINAMVLARFMTLVGSAVFAARVPEARVLPISDESAHYGEVWVRRLTVVPVYGYFALQAGLFLGLEKTLYESLLRVLGLLVLGLCIVLVLQVRTSVARAIAGDRAASNRFRSLRGQLSGLWHWAAIAYLTVAYGIWALGMPGGFMYLVRSTGLTLAAVVAGYVLIRLSGHLFQRVLGVNRNLQEQYPGLQARANRYMPILQAAARSVIYFMLLLSVLQAWGLDTYGWIASEPGLVLVETVATIAAVLLAAAAIWEFTSYLIESYLAESDRFGRPQVRSARTRTLLTVARKALLVTLVVLTVLLVLSELGMNIAPLLATAGVLGLAIGFGSQKLVQDVITGVFILLEDLFAVGDVIKVGDTAGLVEAVSIRNVRLRDLSGTVHTIPFSSIDTISNLTKDFSFYLLDVGVAYKEDVDQVMAVLTDIGEEMRQDETYGPLILEPLEIFGVDRFADSAVIIKGRIKTIPIKQWMVGREFNRRMKNRFDELGIEIPFPHTTLYFGQDKHGEAAAARVAFDMPREVEPGLRKTAQG